jgi:hypothetical protein
MIIAIKQGNEIAHFTIKNIIAIEDYIETNLAVEKVQQSTGLRGVFQLFGLYRPPPITKGAWYSPWREEYCYWTPKKRIMKMHLLNGKTFNCEWDEEIFLTWKSYNKGKESQ